MEKTIYVFRRISRELAHGTPEQLAGIAPELFAEYFGCLAAEANLITVKTLDKFNFAFEVIAQKPFGNSGYGYDERVGLVLNKKLYSED